MSTAASVAGLIVGVERFEGFKIVVVETAAVIGNEERGYGLEWSVAAFLSDASAGLQRRDPVGGKA
jgi:hypothetical protein